MRTEQRSFYWGANANSAFCRNVNSSNHSETDNHGLAGKDEELSDSIHKRQYNIKVWFQRCLKVFNVCFSLLLIILYVYYLTLLWTSAFSRSTIMYIPIPRITLGMKDVLMGENQDFTLSLASIIIVAIFLYAIGLCFHGFLVPASMLTTGVMYLASKILSNTNVYSFYYREATNFTTVKSCCCTLLFIVVIHYLIMLVILPPSKRGRKIE